tara:strand:- start:50 stop:361 length:312 start_codon:yes stop_codon:yes gene_type:complete
VSITITLTEDESKALWDALDHLGLDILFERNDSISYDNEDDREIAAQRSRTYDICQRVMALIEAETVEKMTECDECGGMGHTIGFEGPKKIKYPCESCDGGQS